MDVFRSTRVSSARVDWAASVSAASRVTAFSSNGMEAVAKYCQIALSSGPGSSSTSAFSVARPARPTC